MAEKYWKYLQLQNGDKVRFVPPSPSGSLLGGVSASQVESWDGVVASVDDKQDRLTAGDNITISGNTISAVGGGDIVEDPEDIDKIKVVSTTDNVIVDNSLTLAGMAADAKAVGDALTQQKEDTKQDLNQLEKKKVGYSEVVDSKLMMYSGSTKAILLATLDLPTATPTDVQINGTSITTDGVANIPQATTGVRGVVMTAKRPDHYDGRNTNRYMTTDSMDYAVKTSLTDGKAVTAGLWTPEAQAAACDTIGAEPKKGEWQTKSVTITEADMSYEDILFDDIVSEVFVRFYSPKLEGYTNTGWYPKALDEFGNEFTSDEFYMAQNWVSTSAESYALMHIKHEDGCLCCEASGRLNNNTTSGSLARAVSQNGKLVHKGIKGLRMICSSASRIMVGTTFDVTYR